MRKLAALALAATATLAPALALAQDAAADLGGDALNSGDNAWVLVCSALVLLMVLPGLTLFYGGRVNPRNLLSVMVQIGAIVAAVSVVWIIAGYRVAFGDPTNGWIGGGQTWMLNDTLNLLRGDSSVSERTFALLQMMIAAFAAALMVGAWAGRARFGWVVTFCTLWSLLVYAPIAHWVWGGGWLAETMGTRDFAGGIVVHTAAGVSALIAALLIGKRHGLASASASAHSPVLALAGAGLLWAGWFGLTGGPALSADDNASTAIINTQLGASMAALVWLIIEKFTHGKPTALGFASGGLAGLAAISPAAMFVSPGAAIVIGVLAAIVCFALTKVVKSKLAVDDALGVFAIHAGGGITGALLLAVFLAPELGGVGYDDGVAMLNQFFAQVVGIGAVVLWSAIATAVIAVTVSLAVPMRVSEDDESDGLDLASHGERAWKFD